MKIKTLKNNHQQKHNTTNHKATENDMFIFPSHGPKLNKSSTLPTIKPVQESIFTKVKMTFQSSKYKNGEDKEKVKSKNELRRKMEEIIKLKVNQEAIQIV
jgi:hypothetical protein